LHSHHSKANAADYQQDRRQACLPTGLAAAFAGCEARSVPDNGPELSCPAEAGSLPPILAHAGGPGASPHGTSRRVSFSELGTFFVIISVLLF